MPCAVARLPTVIALAAIALALAGCTRPVTKVERLPAGPLTKEQYVHAFDVSAAGLAPRYGVGKELPADAPAAEQAARVTALQRLLRAWASRLAGLQPPVAAAPAQARYVAGIRGFAADLDRAKVALARGDRKGAATLLSSGRIVSAPTRADLVAARRAFHALGYDLQDLDTAPVKTS
jgi:predicted GNAT family acetyltransferase